MKNVPSSAVAVAALIAAVALPALGATVLHLSFEDLAARSHVVVRAQVKGSTARLDRKAGRVSTYTELSVLEAIKGAPGRKVVVRQPGGEAEGIGQQVAGAARFTVGDEVVLFLERASDEPAVFLVLSMNAGKVRLEKKLGSTRAVRDLEGIHFLPPPADPARAETPPPSQVKVTDVEDLGDAGAFLARIRAAAKAKGKEPAQ